jgi:hypothetical protein
VGLSAPLLQHTLLSRVNQRFGKHDADRRRRRPPQLEAVG